MKTNILFVCLYCDKTLGSKRTVRMHITNLHKANPDSPLMFQQILVSPTNVKKILSGTKPGIKVINADSVNVTTNAGKSEECAVSESPPGPQPIDGLSYIKHPLTMISNC